MQHSPFYLYLEKEYFLRKKRNPAYSLRTFAKFLNINQSHLSRAFKGEKFFSKEKIELCYQILKTPPEIRAQIVQDETNRNADYNILAEDMILLLSNWRYWAILEYLKTSNNNLEVIAQRLSITEDELQKLVDVLCDKGFLLREENNLRLMKPNNSWSQPQVITKARTYLQKQVLELSLNALMTVSVEEREHGSLFVAIDTKKLPAIKEKIRNFRKELGRFAQKEGSLDEVYLLAVSFFPVSHKEI